jgi:neurofibromin 1
MQHHWKYCQDLDNNAYKKQNHKDGSISPMRPSLDRVNDTTPQHSMWSPPEGIPLVPIDPPPLEDNLAKHIIHVMSRFIYQIGILDEKEHGIVANHSASACLTETYTNFNGQTLPTSLIVDTYRAASRVVAYVSASNWSITFAKIKNRILYLTTTQEENPEVTDVMLLECASLNCKRLSMVLTGLLYKPFFFLFSFYKAFNLLAKFRIMQFCFTFEKSSAVVYCSYAKKGYLELD